jgi:hypothetical protein
MKSMKIASLCAALFAASCIVAITPALATEGPFYKTLGRRVRNGLSPGVEVKAAVDNYLLRATISGKVVTVTCTDSKFLGGATIDGSTGGNSSTSKEQIEFTGCSQTGNGNVECTVTGGKITTNALKNTLGYSEAERKGNIQFMFKPESGNEIATVAFTGGIACIESAIVLTGSFVAEALSKNSTIKVGSEPAVEEVVEINIPPQSSAKIWIEKIGKVENESTSLEWGGGTMMTFEGSSELRLTSRNNWGLFTRANPAPTKFLAAEWLVGGVAVTAELATETTGELLFEDTKATTGKVAILCSGIFDGWVGPSSLGWVSEVLNLSGEAISTTPLTGLALECTAQEGCESSGAPKAWPVNLGWETEVDLMEQGGTFFDVLTLPHSGGGNPGWEFECLVIGIAVTDECTASQDVAQLTLEGTSLLDKTSAEFDESAEVKLATCSLGGEESGVVEGEGPIVLKAGGELTASSEGSVS